MAKADISRFFNHTVCVRPVQVANFSSFYKNSLVLGTTVRFISNTAQRLVLRANFVSKHFLYIPGTLQWYCM